ncbi:MAG: DNA-processing protein DprA [Mediterranea sp.]|nr:DNA-processing protein DprA [Mediterranea sp.]
MDEEEIFFCIALTQVPGIGHTGAKRLMDEMKSATAIFGRRNELREILPDVNRRLEKVLDAPQAMKRAEEEMRFIRKNGIRCLTLFDEDFPPLLRECDDAPILLFFKGDAELNVRRTVSMVGTRKITTYGQYLCDGFLKELKEYYPDILITSGLAYGIDIHAHRAALANQFPTVGVLAHGLDRIYPSVHRQTAVKMLEQGGLITEYLSGTEPERYNFISRNRIIAGMSNATVVVESGDKGGALITAEMALGYNRECFAFPGRATDECSQGCNRLIRENKATLIQSAKDFIQAMGWKSAPLKRTVQRSLFPELTGKEQQIANILDKQEKVQVDALAIEADLPIQEIKTLLFGLEMKGAVRTLAGGVYELLH